MFKLNSFSTFYYSTPVWATASLTSATFDYSFATYEGLTGLAYWFSGCQALATINGISNLNTENVTTMRGMFNNCSSLTELNLTGFSTANVTSMYYMFFNCSSLTELDLSGFNTTNVTDASWMFSGCSNLITIYAATNTNWNTETLISGSYMFQNCSNLIGGNGTAVSSNSYDQTRACIDGLDGKPGYFTDKNAPRPYAILSADKTAIAFYYDTQMPVRKAAPENNGATVILRLNSGSQPVWATAELTSATIDASFAGYTGITSLYYWFNGCTGLTSIDLSNLNTANVTNASHMFNECTNLETITFGEHFSTGKVTTMNSMFLNCSKLQAITLGSQFTTDNVTDMSFMFFNCSKLTELDLSSFNTAKVTTTYYMFGGCSNLETIYAKAGTDWDTQMLATSGYMFSSCYKLIGGNGTCYENNSYGYGKARACIDGLDGKPGYFTDPTAPTPYAVVTKNANDKPVAVAFYYDMNMDSHQADNVTIIRSLNDASVASGWTGVTLTSVTFDDSFASFKGLTKLANWFRDCSCLTSIDLSNLNTENVTTMQYMFNGCSSLTDLDLSGFNTEKVTTMQYMFSNCSSLTHLDLSAFNTAKVTTMNYMFYSCTHLQAITFGPQFTTANVTEMSAQFSNCSALTEVDLSTFTIEKLTNALSMFQSCSNLKTIYAKAGTDWSTSTTLSSSYNMFHGCTKLKGGKGTGYNEQLRDKTYARIDGGTSNPGYFTDPDAFLLGDVNNDGSITIADVTALVNIFLGKDNSGAYNHRAANVNGDDSITIADVTELVNIILEKQ